MKYVPPYGISNPDAPYINGDPSIARQGSIPPAEAFEHPMRELVNVITNSFLVPSATDLEQVAKGVRSQRMNFVDDTGSINNLSVAFDPPLGGYSIGLPIRVKILNTNTGPSTIDAGAGRVPIRKPTGAEMAAGDLPGGGLAELVYDGTVFQMINFGGAGGTGGGSIFLTNIPYTVDTSPTANTVTANFSPAITSLAAGFICMVKIANTNNTLANINVNGLGNKAIKAQGGHASWPLLPGDIMVNDVIVFIYDGTSFWIYPNIAINQNVTLNVATVADLTSLFVALSRKRISTSGYLTIQMAAGIYQAGGGIVTYHTDADRVTLQGTMNGQPPVSANFHQSGNSPAQRAQDSSLNIQMCRARYKTEIRFGNTVPMNALTHTGPGQITYKNLLLTGANTPVAQSGLNAIWVANFSSLHCDGVTVWGSGENGFSPNAGYLYANNCHATGCMSNGFSCAGGAGLTITRGGSYGNGGSGLITSDGSMNWITPEYSESDGPYFTCNASYGIAAELGATVYLGYVTVIANALDIYAFDGGVISNYASLANTWSPEINTVGNLNAIYRVY